MSLSFSQKDAGFYDYFLTYLVFNYTDNILTVPEVLHHVVLACKW